MTASGKRRALGQHFLKDPSLIDSIVSLTLDNVNSYSCEGLLEIGPGKGALTNPLLNSLSESIHFTLVERDKELVKKWETIQRSTLKLISGDFLEIPSQEWLKDPSQRFQTGVVSNLPYSSGTAILLKLAEHSQSIPFMLLMFQSEVAQRLRAEPNSKAWGSLSIWIQNFWQVTKKYSVSPSAFSPPPDVNSEVVLLERRDKPQIEIPDVNTWESLLKASFMHRRKMLRSTFPAQSLYRNALERSGLDGTKRAEAMDWKEWEIFYKTALSLK